MSKSSSRLFSNGHFLAVVGDDKQYWLCKCRQYVYEGKTKTFWVQWLEKEAAMYKYPVKTTHRKSPDPNKIDKEQKYYLSEKWGRISLDTVIRALKLRTTQISYITGVGKKVSRLYAVSQYDEKELSESVSRVYHSKTSSNDAEGVLTQAGGNHDSLVVSNNDGACPNETAKQDKVVAKGRKRPIEQTNEIEQLKRRKVGKTGKPDKLSKSKPTMSRTTKSSKKMVSSVRVKAAKKNVKSIETTETPKKNKKEPKPPKKKVDRSDPNWKLKPNEKVTILQKDPMFEDVKGQNNKKLQKVPYVSSVVESRLLIAAVVCNDMNLLKSLKNDYTRIHSVYVPRSMANSMTALHYAIRTSNLNAIKLLSKKETAQRVAAPKKYLKTKGTGEYNYRSLGIRHIRKLNMSRGGREGNNALCKNDGPDERIHSELLSSFSRTNSFSIAEFVMAEPNVTLAVVEKLLELKVSTREHFNIAIPTALYHGNIELARRFLSKNTGSKEELTTGTECFEGTDNRFHYEALSNEFDKIVGTWNTIRDDSVRKKLMHNHVTPIHCAAINPDVRPLKILFEVCHDLYISDQLQRKLVHYAAACSSTSSLEYLESVGANMEDVDKQGITPLMISCMAGRSNNTEYILRTLKKKELAMASNNDDDLIIHNIFGKVKKAKNKVGIGGVDRPQKSSWCPIHFAVSTGNLKCVEVLIQYEVDVSKPLNVSYDKMTPLMLAAAKDDIQMVKLLVEKGKAKIEKHDKFKKTALVHAAMNGSAKVASYFLSKGANPNQADTSKNTCLHYACAYGWFHTTNILIEAGASPLDISNEWGLTPLAISMLKGNVGLAKYLLTLPGIDINGKDEKGKTIMLHMLSESILESKEITEQFLLELKELVEARGAKADATDYSGKNALHYLAEFRPQRITFSENVVELEANVVEQAKLQNRFVEFFITHGCNTFNTEEKGLTPLNICLSTEWDYCNWKNYVVLNTLLDDMCVRLHDKSTGLTELLKHSSGEGILNDFAKSFNLLFVDKERKLLEKIIKLVLEVSKKIPNVTSIDSQVHSTYLESVVEAKLHNRSLLSFTLENMKTPIIQLCNSYASSMARKTTPSWDKRLTCTEHPLLDFYGVSYDENTNIKSYEDMWKKARELICFFITELRPKLFYTVTSKKRPGSENKSSKKIKTLHHSAILSILGDGDSNEPKSVNSSNRCGRDGYSMLLDIMQGPDGYKFDGVSSPEGYSKGLVRQMIDCVNAENCTALTNAVKNGHADICRILISSGADVDFSYDIKPLVQQDWDNGEDIIIVKNKEGKKVEVISKKSCPILDVVRRVGTGIHSNKRRLDAENRNVYLNIFDLLIENGVDLSLKRCTVLSTKTGQEYNPNLFMEAVRNCLKDRYCRSRQYILKKLIQSGVNVNVILDSTEFSRNALHISVDKSTGEANKSLDLEISLLRGGCNTMVKDIIGRYPLHYAFVKHGNHKDSSFSDPIEVCSMLVEAMKKKKGLDEADKFGGTPLMYASYRGATVCCLLLIQEGKANVNATDMFGNTPLVYAVLGRHDGCAAMLLQKGANVNVNIYPNPKISSTSTKKDNNALIPKIYKYLPSHFNTSTKDESKGYTLFEGIVRNGWLGITYLALDQMESFGMLYANAIDVAFHISQLQFAKTLINKQVNPSKLLNKVTDGRNLICSLSYEMYRETETLEDDTVSKKGKGFDEHLMEDILDMLVEVGVSLYEPDIHGCSPFHYACLRHNLPLIKYIITASKINKENIFKVKDNHRRTPLISAFWNYRNLNEGQERSIERNFYKVIKLLIEHCDKSDINCVARIKLLSYLESGIKTSFRNLDFLKPKMSLAEGNATSPLIASIIHEDVDMMKLLLQAGADGHLLSGAESIIPLMHAVKTNNTHLVRSLLSFESLQVRSLLSSGVTERFYIALAADKNYVLEATIDRSEQFQKGFVALKQKVKSGWCNDFYRSQLWHFDKTGKIISEIGAQNYVLHCDGTTSINGRLSIHPEEAKGPNHMGSRWIIEENAQIGGLQIKSKASGHAIDASKGYADIRVTKLQKSKKGNKKAKENMWWSNGQMPWPENWATCWIFTDGNGDKVENVERDETKVKKINSTTIDINVEDTYKRTVLTHAILAEECGIKSVTFDSVKMVNLLMDVGAQCTRETYEMATQKGARKIAKRMALKLEIQEQQDVSQKHIVRPHHETESNLKEAQSRFDYDIIADAKVMLNTLITEAEKKQAKYRENSYTNCQHVLENSESKEDSASNHNIINIEDTEQNIGNIPNIHDKDEPNRVIHNKGGENCEKCTLETYWKKNKHSGCTGGKDSFVFQEYAVLMTKVDVSSFNPWGMYNYYRMQIWKEKHKDHWILFTNWGRIGDENGQYQNTPYGNAEQAIAEFEKIFKSKSGNDWKTLQSDGEDAFQHKSKRYRLVKMEILRPIKRSKIRFNLQDSSVPSKLSKEVRDMIKDISDVAMYVKAYKEIGGDHEAVPFGRIKREVVLQAKEILDELSLKAKQKQTLKKKTDLGNNKEANCQQELQYVVEEISRLSSEYYHLLPKGNHEFVRLEPIDNEQKIKGEMDRVMNILEFEVAERILLGAQFRKHEINPLDYIYGALGCSLSPLKTFGAEHNIELVEKDSNIANLIMQYVYNTANKDVVIDSIYRIGIEEEKKKFKDAPMFNKPLLSQNRTMLWHGTKTENLMGILHRGLLIDAPNAVRCASAYGNGIYLADTFDKSWSYSGSPTGPSFGKNRVIIGGVRNKQKKSNCQYMLLCEAALGEIETRAYGGSRYNPYTHDYSQIGDNNYPPSNGDSLLVMGDKAPEIEKNLFCTTITEEGAVLPLGRVSSTQSEPKHHWNRYSNVFNEYVVYDDKQVSVRYLLKLGSSDKFDGVIDNRESNESAASGDEDSDEEEDEMDEEEDDMDEQVDESDEEMA